MTNDLSAEVAAEIARIVDAAGEVQGAKLAAQVRQKFPDWRFPTTLRRFLEERVPGVQPTRRTGMDLLYARVQPGEPVRPLEPIQAPPESNPWRVWTSPNGHLDLLVSCSTGKTDVVVRSAAPVPADSIRLRPPTTAQHQAIAHAFLVRQDASLTAALKQQLDNEPSWWVRWVPVLRQAGKLDAWREWRRAELLSLLRMELAALTPEVLEKVLATFLSGAKRAPPSTLKVPSETLRAFVVRVVHHMDEKELRALQLPAGAVHAALKSTM